MLLLYPREALSSLRFLNTTLRLGPRIKASASLVLKVARMSLVGLPGLLEDGECDTVDSWLVDFLFIDLVAFIWSLLAPLNLLSVRFLNLRKAFMSFFLLSFCLYTINSLFYILYFISDQ